MDQQLQITINNHILERVTSTNFLGVTIDEHISWKCHIKQVERKISRIIGVLYKCRYLLNIPSMLAIYNSLIYSYLNYCNVIWGGNTVTSLERLHRYQKSFLRVLAYKDRRAHSAPLFVQFKILPIYELFDFNVSQFVYKWYNNLTIYPKLFGNYFRLNEQIHNYPTRQHNDLHAYRFKTNIGLYSIKTQGQMTWNSLPAFIKNSRSLIVFKENYKSYLINNIIL